MFHLFMASKLSLKHSTEVGIDILIFMWKRLALTLLCRTIFCGGNCEHVERDIFQVVTRGYTCHIIACGITMSDLWSCMVISDLLPVAPRVFLSSFFLV